MSERAVKTVNRFMEKTEDPYLSMLGYRTTPLDFGLSPAELLMNRKLLYFVPTISDRQIIKKQQHEEYRNFQKKK